MVYHANREEMDTPDYKAWRLSSFARDGFKCIRCGSREKIEAHHIKPWATHPNLRYVQSNAATLCKSCHTLVTGKEDQYEAELQDLVNQKYHNKRKIVDVKKKSQGYQWQNRPRAKYRKKNPYNRFGG